MVILADWQCGYEDKTKRYWDLRIAQGKHKAICNNFLTNLPDSIDVIKNLPIVQFRRL